MYLVERLVGSVDYRAGSRYDGVLADLNHCACVGSLVQIPKRLLANHRIH